MSLKFVSAAVIALAIAGGSVSFGSAPAAAASNDSCWGWKDHYKVWICKPQKKKKKIAYKKTKKYPQAVYPQRVYPRQYHEPNYAYAGPEFGFYEGPGYYPGYPYPYGYGPGPGIFFGIGPFGFGHGCGLFGCW